MEKYASAAVKYTSTIKVALSCFSRATPSAMLTSVDDGGHFFMATSKGLKPLKSFVLTATFAGLFVLACNAQDPPARVADLNYLDGNLSMHPPPPADRPPPPSTRP